MKEYTQKDIKVYLEKLERNEPEELALWLYVVGQFHERPPQPIPTGNLTIVTYLEKLAEDRRGCRIEWGQPFLSDHITYGELRWFAARVLACEYAYLGIEKPIILKNVVQPIRIGYLSRMAQYQIYGLDELIRQGRLPAKTEIIKPQDYAWCCSKEAVEEHKENQDKNE